MTTIRLLDAQAVREHTDPIRLRELLAQGLVSIALGTLDVPARISAHGEHGLVGAMPGYVPGMGMAAKLVTVFPGNHERGLPSHQGVVALFDSETGSLQALLDAATVTAIRTAHNAAVAADLLARPDATSLCILGAGVQGREHLRAFADLRSWTSIRVSSRNIEHARAIAREFPRCTVVEDFNEAVAGSDVVCCCTDSQEPIFLSDSVQPGAHVSSVGRGAEVPAGLLTGRQGVRVFVEWPGAVTSPPPAGAAELQHLASQGTLSEEVVLIGDALLQRREGRTGPEEITIFKSTGHAVQDLAVAVVALAAVGDAVPTVEI